MVRKMTIYGTMRRQLAVAVFFCLSLGPTIGSAASYLHTSDPNPVYLQNPFEQEQLRHYLPVITDYGHGNSTRFAGVDTQIWPGTVSYTRVVKFMDPYLQEDLRMGIDYTYQFNIQLFGRDPKATPSNVPDGWYQMDVAVVRPEMKTFYMQAINGKEKMNPYERYVTSRSLLVRVSGGRVNRKVTLRFPNISATTIVNHLFIQLTPLQVECPDSGRETVPCISTLPNGQANLDNSRIVPLQGFRPSLMEVAFVPYMQSGSGTSNPDDALPSPNPETDTTLSQYIASAQANLGARTRFQRPNILKPATYASRKKLLLLSTHDQVFENLGKRFMGSYAAERTLNTLIGTQGQGAITVNESAYQNLWPTLCAVLAKNNQYLQTEIKKPQSFVYTPEDLLNRTEACALMADQIFRLAIVEHVYAFNANGVTVPVMNPMHFTMQTNFMVSRSHSEDSYRAITFNPLELAFRISDAFSLPIRALGLGFSISGSVSDGRGTSESTSGSISMGLDFNLLTVQVPVVRSQRCLEVEVLPRKGSPFYDSNTPNARNGLYICADESQQPHMSTEVYAHIFSHSGDTSIIDNFDPRAQSVNVVLQGDRDISVFYFLTRSSLTPEHDTRIQPFTFLESARTYFAATPSSGNGLIVNPILFPKDGAPSIVKRALGLYQEKFVGQN